MHARHVLDINGNFKESPLLRTARILHRYFSELDIPYAIVGGLAVVRHRAVRTTVDVDVLTRRTGWAEVTLRAAAAFETWDDHAVAKESGITIDILFPGDEWEMDIPIPHPVEIREWDDELGGWYIDLLHLIELKTAVYLKKRREDGDEIAAKDLADVVALTQNNLAHITEEFIEAINPAVREVYGNIAEKVTRRKRKGETI